MQPLDTGNYTYNEVAAVPCDTATGACSGVLSKIGSPTIDLTGWTWASGEDVADLFYVVTGAPAGSFDNPNAGTSYTDPQPSLWGAAFIDTDGAGPDTGLFHATATASSTDHGVLGLTRSLTPDGSANRSYIRSTSINDAAITGNPIPLDTPRASNGFWFYRPVPEPGVPLLLAAACVLGSLRRARVMRE